MRSACSPASRRAETVRRDRRAASFIALTRGNASIRKVSSQARTEEKEQTMTRRNPVSLLMAIALFGSVCGAVAAEPDKDIVVFDFEMMDSSAGAGILPPDERDAQYLTESTQVAK